MLRPAHPEVYVHRLDGLYEAKAQPRPQLRSPLLVDAVGSEGGESGGGIGDGGGSDGGGGDFNVGVGVGDVDDRIRVLGKTINMLRPAHPEVHVHLLGGSHHAKAQRADERARSGKRASERGCGEQRRRYRLQNHG